MKKLKHLLPVALFIMIIGNPIASKGANYEITSASYIGTDGSEAVIGTAIQTDGTLVLGVNTSQSSFGGTSATTLNGASNDSEATIIRLSTDGQTVKSITKVGNEINDMVIDGLDNIYVALNEGGALKLNSDASSIAYSVSVEIGKLDAGPSGYCVMMGDRRDYNFDGFQMVRLYDPNGKMILERYSNNRYKDVGLNEKEQMIITAGFNVDFICRHEYHLPFYEGIQFNGARKYIGYNWSAKDWAGKNPFEHVRPRTMAIGQDNKMYIGHSWTGNANNVFFWDPFDRTKKVSVVGGDQYTARSALSWGEEGDSKVKFAPFRYNVDDGSFMLGQLFAPKSSSGPNYIAVKWGGSITADADGHVYAAGTSASGLPLETSPTSEEYFDPYPADYSGGGFFTIFSSDFSKRLYITRLNFDRLRTVSPRKLNGNKVILVGGNGDTDKSGAYTKNAIQSSFGGGDSDGHYVVINSPGSVSSPSAPSNLNIVSSSATSIELKWSDNSSNEDGFLIERKTGTGSYEKIATVFYDNTEYTDLMVEGNTSYTYRVKAFNLSGESSASDEKQVSISTANPPEKPSGLSANALNKNEIMVTWNEVANANGYLLEQKEQGENTFKAKADLSGNKSSYNITGLSAGLEYTYRLRAYNEDGYSDFTSTTKAITQNLPLHDTVNPSNITQGLCFKAFEKASNYGEWPDFSALTSYKTETTNNFTPASNSDPLDLDFALWYKGYLEVPEDGTYYFVLNVDKGGMLFIDGNMVIDNSSWKWGDYQKKGQIGLKAGKHKLSVQHFFDYKDTDEGPVIEIYIKGGGISKQLISDNMLYRDNSCDFSCTAPSAPSNLSVNVLSGNKLELTWEDNANEIGYNIHRNYYEWNKTTDYVEFDRVGEDVTKYINYHLLADSMYKYRIEAFNACGTSDFSNVVSTTTGSSYDYSPAAPDLLEITQTEATKITVGWRDNSFSEDGFKIEVKESGGVYSEIDSTGRDQSSYTVEGLNPNTNYVIRVRAYNSDGVSDYTNEVSATTEKGTGQQTISSSMDSKTSIYPNPADQQINITAPVGSKVEIRSIIGQILYSGVLNNSSLSLNTKSWESGLYIVKIKHEDSVTIRRIIIQ